jgi:hypothetical protein
MGANEFRTSGTGANAQEVFSQLRDQAAWDRGHGGYTGTIAEKPGFVVVPVPPDFVVPDDLNVYSPRGASDHDQRVYGYAEALQAFVQNADGYLDPRFPGPAQELWNDKWGPAVALRLDDTPEGQQCWLFCGLASS